MAAEGGAGRVNHPAVQRIGHQHIGGIGVAAVGVGDGVGQRAARCDILWLCRFDDVEGGRTDHRGRYRQWINDQGQIVRGRRLIEILDRYAIRQRRIDGHFHPHLDRVTYRDGIANDPGHIDQAGDDGAVDEAHKIGIEQSRIRRDRVGDNDIFGGSGRGGIVGNRKRVQNVFASLHRVGIIIFGQGQRDRRIDGDRHIDANSVAKDVAAGDGVIFIDDL